ncbi:formylmethanofuran dehydrogenase subunit C [Candidatus Bathyarchaeota archaeon]|nr:formylmethanofuran dehydrogenase subunit C [Candidatus Bathyarchaeota archaeon]NIU80995.1 formylmethanofuran dehydrogenase subunit C [Candidatus Bathyarchaeota archaeon]NIV67640.1 formylmethanofuran dehydrogenase subunit C [Candidatus Bathyarchaeota archaeon]NIW16175.1 formylmethanofuran dehydrogenase subunit C [Candidatus Bathyarchaeota archaeon]NIW34261.1 formylmethanofuran dehydrogenase subunit C [Candidatus Bathyarchaeota archaeon]
MIRLVPKRKFTLPVDGECITPDIFSEKSLKEIASLYVWEGNRRRPLNELFKIDAQSESSENSTVQICGDAEKIRRIGAQMSSGNIIIEGDAGMHLGERMGGGTISVTGNAGSWTGCAMKKGTIEIKGNAGDYLGAAYRGSVRGMRGGSITVQGEAGNEVGLFMRGGIIKIHGNVGLFAGIHMQKGTILIQGDAEGHVGAEMSGGKIVLCGYTPSVLPTFTIDSIKPSVKVEGEKIIGPFYRFLGDLAENGSGKLYVSQDENRHLKTYERFL